MKELDIPTPMELESLVTSAVYASLLTARLSPASNPRIVHITSVAPVRDLRPGSLPEMLQILETWGSRCTGVISEIESQIKTIKDEAKARRLKEIQRQDIIDQAVLKEDSDTRSAGPLRKDSMKSPTEDRKVKGSISGSKRDIQEQQASDEPDDGDEDGGVGVGVSRMEVDEGSGAAKANIGGRSSKRFFGKKS